MKISRVSISLLSVITLSACGSAGEGDMTPQQGSDRRSSTPVPTPVVSPGTNTSCNAIVDLQSCRSSSLNQPSSFAKGISRCDEIFGFQVTNGTETQTFYIDPTKEDTDGDGTKDKDENLNGNISLGTLAAITTITIPAGQIIRDPSKRDGLLNISAAGAINGNPAPYLASNQRETNGWNIFAWLKVKTGDSLYIKDLSTQTQSLVYGGRHFNGRGEYINDSTSLPLMNTGWANSGQWCTPTPNSNYLPNSCIATSGTPYGLLIGKLTDVAPGVEARNSVGLTPFAIGRFLNEVNEWTRPSSVTAQEDGRFLMLRANMIDRIDYLNLITGSIPLFVRLSNETTDYRQKSGTELSALLTALCL